MPHPAGVLHSVEFAETDAAGVVHFSNYFRFMERAERAFFEEVGLPLLEDRGVQLAGFPRVEAWCRYRAPLRFGDRVRIIPYLREIRSASLRFEFVFSSPTSSQMYAEGGFTTVYSIFDRTKATFEARQLPTSWVEELTPLVASEPSATPDPKITKL